MPFGRQTPFDELEKLLNRMGRELEAEEWPGAGGVDVDLADHGEQYVVTADLPGYEKADVDVKLVGGDLRIEAERDLDDEGEDGPEYLRRERRREAVSRRLRLPEPVDEEDVAATLEAGVLTVELAKRTGAEGTAIDID